MFYSADFETTTNEEKTEVRLSGFARLLTDEYHIQTDIEQFMYELFEDILKNNIDNDDVIVFFHNLKFDGSFIANYLHKIGMTFETFIQGSGLWYSLSIEMENFKVIFRDSLKVLNFSIAKIGEGISKDTNLNILKGDTPLLKHKPDYIKEEWVPLCMGLDSSPVSFSYL